ncbi:MAG: methyltransferase domain-containing protein [Lachnospiraceae bacterium]|jgi:2-polyprenyl-3-methyl-5-hydroxy-6-metoxy-1,4-benzoquinol methylase|nr:methyltransferase domain-containing protein [Lachnospiraceae bacterium]
MVRDLYERICAGEDTRANLIQLKKEIKAGDQKRAFAYLLGGDFSRLGALLDHEDPKVRKNAALILGEMECEDMLPSLWDAYEREEQLFVKPAYLQAMRKYDYSAYLPEIKQYLERAATLSMEPENQKHYLDEMAELTRMVLKYEKPSAHTYLDGTKEREVILMTNRNHREITREQLDEEKHVLLAGGVRLRSKEVKGLMKIRTFTELLFPLPKLTTVDAQPQEAAKQLAGWGIAAFIRSMHRENGPFCFRVEYRGRLAMDKKSDFLRKFTRTLEAMTGRQLINSTSDYEVELRLLEKKDGGYVPLLKLYTLPDERFSYRKNALSSSIAPANAALVMQLAKPWLKENAQVLDPFCGVGTMLIERNFLKPANPMYGVDIFREAIEKGRENAEAAGVLINYINRDFLDFRHEYLFDEIVSNLPGVTRTKDMEQITRLYEGFFKKVPEVLKENGILVLYTPEESILLYCLKKFSYLERLGRWVINEREGSVLFVLKLIEIPTCQTETNGVI